MDQCFFNEGGLPLWIIDFDNIFWARRLVYAVGSLPLLSHSVRRGQEDDDDDEKTDIADKALDDDDEKAEAKEDGKGKEKKQLKTGLHSLPTSEFFVGPV